MVGESPAEHPLGNTYISYHGIKAKDFDLKLSVKGIPAAHCWIGGRDGAGDGGNARFLVHCVPGFAARPRGSGGNDSGDDAAGAGGDRAPALQALGVNPSKLMREE